MCELCIELGSASANFIRREFYVDDGLKSVASAEEAVTLIKDNKEMCKEAASTCTSLSLITRTSSNPS